MLVYDLPTDSPNLSTDYIPIARGTATYKIPLSSLAPTYQGTLGTKDLNSLTTPGIYLLTSSYSYSNCPVTAGLLECISSRSNAVYVQRITTPTEMYFRFATTTVGTYTWGAWRRVSSSLV